MADRQFGQLHGAVASVGLEDADSLALLQAVHAHGNDQVAWRQPVRHAHTADHGLAQRHLLPMRCLGGVVDHPDEATRGIVRREGGGERDDDALGPLGDLGARLATHAAGHAWQDGDALRRGEQDLDRVGARGLGWLRADLGQLGRDLDAGEGIERGLEVDHVRDEGDQRFRHVDDHLDLGRIDEAHDRLLRLHLLECLGENSADDARERRAQLGIAELELGALLRRLQRSDLGRGLLGRRIAVFESGLGDDALRQELLVAIELAGRIGIGGPGALQVGSGEVEVCLIGSGVEDS